METTCPSRIAALLKNFVVLLGLALSPGSHAQGVKLDPHFRQADMSADARKTASLLLSPPVLQEMKRLVTWLQKAPLQVARIIQSSGPGEETTRMAFYYPSSGWNLEGSLLIQSSAAGISAKLSSCLSGCTDRASVEPTLQPGDKRLAPDVTELAGILMSAGVVSCLDRYDFQATPHELTSLRKLIYDPPGEEEMTTHSLVFESVNKNGMKQETGLTISGHQRLQVTCYQAPAQ
jgi:hypothetical protein